MIKICKRCNKEFEANPKNIMKCNDCRHEEYVLELKQKNPNVIVIGRFTGKRNKVEHKCLIHNHTWSPRCADVVSGSGCEFCRIDKLSMSNEEYVKRIKKINPYVKPLEKYKNNRTNIKHKCLIDTCGYEWSPQPGHILEGHGCPKCAGVARKTHEDYVEELKQINPNLMVIEKYDGKDTPIKHRCMVEGCNYEWSPIPNNLLRGANCPRCSNCERYDTDSYKSKLRTINEKVEILEEYQGSAIPIKTRCLIDNHIWSIRPGDLLRGYGCPKCGIRSRIEKQSLTNEDFTNKLNSMHGDKIICLETYVSSKFEIKFKCQKEDCNHEWTSSPGNVIYGGTGCPKCANNIRYTTQGFRDIMKIINPNVEVVGKYINKETPIECICKIDNHRWSPRPGNLMNQNAGCPKCAAKSRGDIKRLSNEEFIQKLKQLNSNKLEVKGEYIGTKNKIDVKCLECAHEWKANPADLLYSGSGCPECAAKQVESKLATEAKALIASKFPESAVKELKGCINPDTGRDLPFDISFKVEKEKYIIEIHGPQHKEYIPYFHRNGKEDLDYQIRKDEYKKDWAISNGYNYKVFWTEEDTIDTVKKFINLLM